VVKVLCICWEIIADEYFVFLLAVLFYPDHVDHHPCPLKCNTVDQVGRVLVLNTISTICNLMPDVPPKHAGPHTRTYLYAKFSACFLDPMSCTIAKNCWCPSNFSCFSSTNIKWCPKHDCIMTQSTAPGKLMSVAKNTISSPVITENRGN
jgi:hypothetical protein